MRIGGLILAGGAGARLGRAKQFLTLIEGERLVDRAVVTTAKTVDWVGLVLPSGHSWEGEPVDAVCVGGDSRYASLAAGLAIVPANIEIVLVNSASHPLASVALHQRLIAAVEAGADGAVPFLEAVDVIKAKDDGGELTTVGREGYGAAQCPMAFDRAALQRAFERPGTAIEESALVEANGGTIVGVAGEVSNVHVTEGVSLAAVRALAERGIDPSDPCTFETG